MSDGNTEIKGDGEIHEFDTEAEFEAWKAAREAERAEAAAPTNQTPVAMDASTVQRMIDQALERQQAQHQREMDQLRGQLATARASLPASLVPEHAGGVGVDTVAETWSDYDRALAAAGQHPHQHGKSADWLARPEDVDEQRFGNAITRQRREPVTEAA